MPGTAGSHYKAGPAKRGHIKPALSQTNPRPAITGYSSEVYANGATPYHTHP
jgi:hypothetical protein